jgi:tetratricopeptide (TPR) repeat protein
MLPLVLLLVLEGVLRLFRWGYDTSLFIEYPGNSDYWVMNPDASRLYFMDQLNATTGNQEPFRKVKEVGTMRIFVLGESTTIGYPYFHNGSFHRWLQWRLMHDHPDKKIEMVNLSLTAVNSYTVAGFAQEVVRYEPDAVLIYTGHNEYYGALGVGSTERMGSGPGMVRFLLWARRSRVVQLMSRVIGMFGSGSRAGKTRMEVMAGDQQIVYGSKEFYRGIDQYRENMDRALAVLQRAGVPVYWSNLVCNEKDLRPLASWPSAQRLAPVAQQQLVRGQQALGAGDSVAAWNALLSADSVDSGYALCRYDLGRLAYGRGEYGLAAKYLASAKELDALRFRAPDSINGVIAAMVTKYPVAHLVDARKAFDSASQHGIIGDPLILDHVHPNLRGYALLAGAFYAAMGGKGRIDYDDMPVTVVDSLNGVYRIAHLRRSWPFLDSAHGVAAVPSRTELHVVTPEEQLAYGLAFEHLGWEDAMERLYEEYSRRGDWKKARGVMEGLVLEHPGEGEYVERTAMLCGKAGEYDKAIFYFGQAFRLQPSFDRARYLFVLCLQQDRPAEAMPYLDYAISNNPQGMDLGPVKAGVMEVMRLQGELARDSANPGVIDSIARVYQLMGNKEGAIKYDRKARQGQGGPVRR